MCPSVAAQSPSVARSRPDFTRERILDAAVEAISRDGFQQTNLARIARVGGMTTGAIQHHFGDKASLLSAVVERGFDSLALRVADLPVAPPASDATDRTVDRAGRIARVVEALWSGYEAQPTRASLEILFAMRADENFQRRSLPFFSRMNERVDRLWMGSFWDFEVSRERHLAAQRLVFATLNGLALERILMPSMPDVGSDLATIVRSVVHIFEEESA